MNLSGFSGTASIRAGDELAYGSGIALRYNPKNGDTGLAGGRRRDLVLGVAVHRLHHLAERLAVEIKHAARPRRGKIRIGLLAGADIGHARRLLRLDSERDLIALACDAGDLLLIVLARRSDRDPDDALDDGDLRTRFTVELDVESGADRLHLATRSLHDKGALLVVRHLEQRLAAIEPDQPTAGRIGNLDTALRGQGDDRPIVHVDDPPLAIA